MGSGEFSAHGRSLRYCRHTPSDQKYQGVRRQVSWLTARSRSVWPSRKLAPSVTTLFHTGKSHISLAVYSCGGSCGFGDHLRSPHRIPFSSRLRANRCTARCCVSRREFVNQLCRRKIVKKFLKWTGFVVASLVGLLLLGYAWIY